MIFWETLILPGYEIERGREGRERERERERERGEETREAQKSNFQKTCFEIVLSHLELAVVKISLPLLLMIISNGHAN